ncbi:MAG: SDR family oxidoreductase [Pseudomonadales bacterium]|nr:SDR family oxidoreductase [Pseudomonadales bacterium]
MKNILIIGANSAIAKATARLYAQENCRLFLLGRDTAALAQQQQDLLIRGASEVNIAPLDVTHFTLHEAAIDQALDLFGQIDLALICHGSLPDQIRCQDDFDAALEAFNINALSVISLLTHLSARMMAQRHGCLAVITSVAGDRGRQSNYVYGAAKGMVSRYLQGLRGRLFPHNVHVVDIRPGFVDTPMTAHLPKGALWASPEQIAQAVVNGVAKRRHTVYAPAFWRFIMLIVRCIPEFMFKRLKF